MYDDDPKHSTTEMLRNAEWLTHWVVLRSRDPGIRRHYERRGAELRRELALRAIATMADLTALARTPTTVARPTAPARGATLTAPRP
jgi:hypothetical protein